MMAGLTRVPLPFLSFLLVLLVVFTLQPTVTFAQDDVPVVTTEVLFRSTLTKWRSRRNDYTPWIDFTKDLLTSFEEKATTSQSQSQSQSHSHSHSHSRPRLEIIGGFEEAILVIEKSTLHEGENLQRDAALSQLYAAYGQALRRLDPQQCLDLARDPHTLLIGAETATTNPPSTHLCIENAENALRNAASLDATNAHAERLLRELTGGDNNDDGNNNNNNNGHSVHKRKPKEFVAELFDSFADSFDEKLESLQYKVPQYVGQTAEALGKAQQGYRAILDAGCGTGLAGRFLLPLKRRVMIGVDASQKMLNIAKKCTTNSGCGLTAQPQNQQQPSKPLYEGLLVMDLEDMTLDNTLHKFISKDSHDTMAFDLIVAADVLVYFGNLSNLFRVFATISAPGAGLVFSCERATLEEAPLGWRLLPSGRFAHTKEHAVDVAVSLGYELLTYEQIIPRMEKGKEVRGHLFGFVLKEQQTTKDEL